jgi:hypothetical protein
MRKLLLIAVLTGYQFCFGQTTEEWTQQKKKQIEYLLKQIAANKVYIDRLEKGYNIARNGLQVIQHIKKGDLDLHADFFASLKNVNPHLKLWARVKDIIASQVRIIQLTRETITDIKLGRQFTDDEVNYCSGVFDNLLEECLKNIDELVMILTDGDFEMKDDERMQRIGQFYSDMQDKYSFASSFSNETGTLSAQRISEQADINLSRKINGY